MPPTRSILDQCQHAAALDAELASIVRLVQLMRSGLRAGELSTAYACQLGRSVLAVMEEAVTLTADTDDAERAA